METLSTSIKCVLFDLDGTLIDTAADFHRVLDKMLDTHGCPRLSDKKVKESVSDGARALVALAFDIDENDPNFATHLTDLLDLYFQQLQNTEARPYPGILDLLQTLEASGICWGIVTNKPEKYSRLLLQNLELLDRCQTLICPEHVTERKPHPEPLLLACKTLGVDTEHTVYIGDHVRDMQAAKNADIIAIAARYGYLQADAKIEEWNADFIIASAQDTISLLKTLKFA